VIDVLEGLLLSLRAPDLAVAIAVLDLQRQFSALNLRGAGSATVHAIGRLRGIGIAALIGLALAMRIVGIVVCIVQQQRRLEACLEGQRALERTCTRGALRRMGLEFGLSSLRIDQQLPAKGETVHGLSPLREADSALISARTRLEQRIFRHDDARVSTALQRIDTALQRIVLTKRALGFGGFLERHAKTRN
jgi:hypothetical protein